MYIFNTIIASAQIPNQWETIIVIPPLKPGSRKCLKCDRLFKSVDLTTNRICTKCNKKNLGTYLIDTIYTRSVSQDERMLQVN